MFLSHKRNYCTIPRMAVEPEGMLSLQSHVAQYMQNKTHYILREAMLCLLAWTQGFHKATIMMSGSQLLSLQFICGLYAVFIQIVFSSSRSGKSWWEVFELQSHAEKYQVNKLVVTQLIFENYLGFDLVAQP